MLISFPISYPNVFSDSYPKGFTASWWCAIYPLMSLIALFNPKLVLRTFSFSILRLGTLLLSFINDGWMDLAILNKAALDSLPESTDS